MSRRTKSRVARMAEDGLVPQGGVDAVGNGRPRKEVPPVSPQAKSRQFMGERFESSAHYAKFAVAGGFDVFDGEPIERFAALGKMDDRQLRMRGQELREEMFRAEMQAMAARQKRLTG